MVISLFQSYSFDKNILTPAAAFRFTAGGMDKAQRLSIRSGDLINVLAVDDKGTRTLLATGIVDETDTHVSAKSVEYVITGRDMIGQLIDNASVDSNNIIQNGAETSLVNLLKALIANTRIPPAFLPQQVPNGTVFWQTMAGETKINTLQRYMEFGNCLIWCAANGSLIFGKPNYSQEKAGFLRVSSTSPSGNNMLEVRVRRNLNQAIRQIVTQLSTMDNVAAGSYTVRNQDRDVRARAGSLVGRSVYESFSYGNAGDAYNTVEQIGNDGSPQSIGQAKSNRVIARDNMKVLDVECSVEGHLNANGIPYNIDQIYNVQIDDEDVAEDMLVYAATYDLTLEAGATTKLKLCRLGTIVAYAEALRRVSK